MALREILVAAQMEKGFQAQKYLADKKWETKRGRPSKHELEGENRKLALITDEVDEIFDSAGQPTRLN